MRVAVLGAGHVGSVVARLAAAAGFEVAIAASGDPEEIALTIQVLAPGAEARWATDAVAEAAIVVLAIPLDQFEGLDPELLAGKVVVDMMNYWPAVNGRLGSFEGVALGSTEIVAQRLSRSRVVKTLNHLGYHQLDEESRPAASPDRRALAVAGDDSAAVELVANLIEGIGFDPIRLGSLPAGRVLEPDGPVFGRPLSRAGFEEALGVMAA